MITRNLLVFNLRQKCTRACVLANSTKAMRPSSSNMLYSKLLRSFSKDYKYETDEYSGKPYTSSIDKVEEEREEYYRQRHLRYYGVEDSAEVQKKYEIKDIIIKKPKLSKTIEEKSPLGEPIGETNKNSTKDEKNYTNFMNFRMKMCYSGILLCLYLVYSNSYAPYKIFKNMRTEVQKDKRVSKIIINKITKDQPHIVKIVLVENEKLNYQELEDMIFPFITKTNIDDPNGKLSYFVSYAGACFAMFAIAVPQNNVLRESLILLTNICLLTFFFSCADNVSNLHKIYQLKRSNSKNKKDAVYVRDMCKIMNYQEYNKFIETYGKLNK